MSRVECRPVFSFSPLLLTSRILCLRVCVMAPTTVITTSSTPRASPSSPPCRQSATPRQECKYTQCTNYDYTRLATLCSFCLLVLRLFSPHAIAEDPFLWCVVVLLSFLVSIDQQQHYHNLLLSLSFWLDLLRPGVSPVCASASFIIIIITIFPSPRRPATHSPLPSLLVSPLPRCLFSFSGYIPSYSPSLSPSLGASIFFPFNLSLSLWGNFDRFSFFSLINFFELPFPFFLANFISLFLMHNMGPAQWRKLHLQPRPIGHNRTHWSETRTQ